MRAQAALWPRLVIWSVSLAAALWLAGCAQPPKVNTLGASQVWTGRIAITVDSAPVQRWNAGFELQGTQNTGVLHLFSPLGQTVASAQWTPLGARLQQNNTQRDYAHMTELTETLVGAALPLDNLFDWLQGKPTPADGWTVDTSGYAKGRIQAERLTPLPAVQLRLVLDTP